MAKNELVLTSDQQKIEEERKQQSINSVSNIFIDPNLRMAMCNAVESSVTEEELYSLVTTDYHLTPDMESHDQDIVKLFNIVLDNDKCNVATLKAMIDYDYVDVKSRCMIYQRIISHKNATKEIYSTIMDLVKHTLYFTKICHDIAINTDDKSILRALLDCNHEDFTLLLSTIAIPIMQNENTDEDLIFDTLLKCIIYSDTLSYYFDYSDFLAKVVTKTNVQSTLELTICFAIDSDFANNSAVLEALLDSGKKISQYLFERCLSAILKDANALITQINLLKISTLQKNEINTLKKSNVLKILLALVSSGYQITSSQLLEVLHIAKSIDLPILAAAIEKRKDCTERHLQKVLYLKQNQDSTLAKNIIKAPDKIKSTYETNHQKDNERPLETPISPSEIALATSNW